MDCEVCDTAHGTGHGQLMNLQRKAGLRLLEYEMAEPSPMRISEQLSPSLSPLTRHAGYRLHSAEIGDTQSHRLHP